MVIDSEPPAQAPFLAESPDQRPALIRLHMAVVTIFPTCLKLVGSALWSCGRRLVEGGAACAGHHT